MIHTPQLITVCVCRSPICRLIAAEELWTLLDALREPVPAEVHQHLENISSLTTPLLVSYQYYCKVWICEGMYYYGIKKIGCAGAHAIEVSTQMTFPFSPSSSSSPPSLPSSHPSLVPSTVSVSHCWCFCCYWFCWSSAAQSWSGGWWA